MEEKKTYSLYNTENCEGHTEEMWGDVTELIESIISSDLEHRREDYAEVAAVTLRYHRSRSREIDLATDLDSQAIYNLSLSYIGIGYLLAAAPEKLGSLTRSWHEKYGTQEMEGRA